MTSEDNSIYDELTKLRSAYDDLRAELRSEESELDYDAIVSKAMDCSIQALTIADVARALKS